jgi:hypothetical protein
MAAIFPGAVATQLQLLTAINNTKVTLNADAGIGDTTVTVDDASPLPLSGYLTFDDHETNPETVFYTGVSGNNLTGVTRGADSTSAAAHVTGAHLEQRWNAAYHNTLTLEIASVEQYLSDRFGIGSSLVVPSTKTLTLAATTNQLVLGTTNTTTVTSTAPSASRIYTIPDAGGNVQFVMAGGTQTVAGAKTFSSAVTITPTTNQLVLGVTNTTTISATAPASSAVYTIPDVGTTANFVMSNGTQIIAGSKTFSSSVTISGNNGLVIKDGEGTPKTVTIQSPATLTSTWALTLPVGPGTNGYVLSTDGSGTTSWIAGGGVANPMTGDLAAGSHKITGLANGTAAGDAAAFGQIYYGFQAPLLDTDANAVNNSGTTYTTTFTAATITPTSASHRIKITVTGVIASLTAATNITYITVMRGSTDLNAGNGFGFCSFAGASGTRAPVAISMIDSPATTSSVTYTVKIKNAGGSNSCTWNIDAGYAIMILEEIV